MPIELTDYQVEGVEYALHCKYSINADDMGLGKTFQALAAADRVSKYTLVVCPAYLRENWRSEIGVIYPDKLVTVFDNAKKIHFPADSDIVVISYSQLDYVEELFEWADMVIADEIHYCKNLSSNRGITFHMRLYKSEVPYFMGLTGTPISNHVSDFYSLLGLLPYNPSGHKGLDIFDRFPTIIDYQEYFCLSRIVRGHEGYVTKYFGLKNVETLKKYVRHGFISRKTKDVLSLEEIRFKHIQVDYKIRDDLLVWEDFKADKDTNSRSKRESAEKKAKFTANYVKGLSSELPNEHFIIYSDHRPSAKAIAGSLKCPFITGETPSKKRGLFALDFQKGKYKFLVATIGSFSTGINLTKACHLIVNDLSWKVGDNQQMFKRIHRKGQTRACTIHIVQGSPQDKYINSLLIKKEEVIKGVLGE